MQSINFLGNGSGFSESHNNAYFVNNQELVLIDLSMTNLFAAKKLMEKYKHISLLLTHMHDDHVSGIMLFSQYCFYVKNIKLSIIVPRAIKKDFLKEMEIKGVSPDIINLYEAETVNSSWLLKVIPTTHAEELHGKCFGYLLQVNNNKCLYSGDTNNLDTFKEYIPDAKEIYLDMSISYGRVHLLWEKEKERILKISKEKEVYLMHIDDMKKMQQALNAINPENHIFIVSKTHF